MSQPLGVPMERPKFSPPVRPPFRPLGGLAIAVTVLLGACAAADIFAIAAGGNNRSLLADLSAASQDELESADSLYVLAGTLQLAATVVTGVVFIVWFHRTRTNAVLFNNPMLRNAAGWAIGGWFIPFANFFIPKRIANDVWAASAPPRPDGSGRPTGTGIVTGWWTLWVGSFVAARLTSSRYEQAETPEALRTATELLMAVDAIDLAAAVLAIIYVRKLTAMQTRKNSLALSSADPSL